MICSVLVLRCDLGAEKNRKKEIELAQDLEDEMICRKRSQGEARYMRRPVAMEPPAPHIFNLLM
jgi:hypothetical protein